MKFIKHDIEYESREDSTWFLVGLGDIHRGHIFMNEDLFYRHLDWIEETPNCRVVCMGDYGDCINAKDPRHDYNVLDWQYATPDKQYMKTTADLERIKDKIIVMLDGNHDYGFWRRHNHNFVDRMAYDLGVPYAGVSSYVRLRFIRQAGKSKERRPFNIYAHHGWTGARTDAYKVKIIQDLSNIFPMLNLYMMGHVHRLGEALPTTKLYVDNRGNIREWVEKYVFTGSYLKGYEKGVGSYIEARGYKPTGLGSPIIEIRPNRTDKGYKDKRKPPFSIRLNTLDFLHQKS